MILRPALTSLKLGAPLVAAALSLTACETAEGYRQQMSTWTRAPSDRVIIEWGEPDQVSALSDGGEVWSYTRRTVSTSGGYTEYETRERKVDYVDHDGEKRSRTETETFPVWVPPVQTTIVCTTRFVIGAGLVQEVTFNGEGCVAPETR